MSTLPSPELFWSRTAPGDDDQGHVLWLGCCHPSGYGSCHHQLAHRVAWQLEFGEIPARHCVFHLCRGPNFRRCVRPEHLCCGTSEVREQYKRLLGTHTHGDRHWARRDPDKALRHLKGLR